MEILLTISVLLLLAALAGCAVLWKQRAALLAERGESTAQQQALITELAALRPQIEVAREKQKAAEQLLAQAQDTFKALAGDALRQSSTDFLKLAEERFKAAQNIAGEQIEARKLAIEALLKPVKETLDKYNTDLKEIEKARSQAYGSLTSQLQLMQSDQRRLRDETANLVKALRRPEVRGRWGEMQLRRVAELAGMIENCDFTEQHTLDGDSGRLRPDMVVRLPSDRCIVVDAKTPIDAFVEAVEAPDDATRQRCMERHADQIEAKVKDLAGKNYQQQFDRSPDFVVLFIPGESFLQAAVEVRPQLIESAMARGVVIATPTTLISLLRAVAVGWREERVADNARKIGEAAGELHERLCTMAGYVQDMGESIKKTVEQYNRFVNSLDKRAIPSIKKLEDLHAQSEKKRPDLPEITVLPIESKALAVEVRDEK